MEIKLSPTSRDPLSLHRASLRPFWDEADSASTETALMLGQGSETERFLEFLSSNSLAPLWFDTLKQSNLLQEAEPELREGLQRLYHQSVATYLLQQKLCEEVDQICEAAARPYAVFKGAQIRELLYPEPALRPAVDVDVLIAQQDRTALIEAFEATGFELHIEPRNRTHEASLQKGQAIIDLHWNILRPGRTRTPLAEYLLAGRVRSEPMWVLNDSACLFVMLVHPVITEHLNSEHSLLIHVVDLNRWLRSREVDWDAVIDLLNMAGLRTAAWTMLTWLELMIPGSAPLGILDDLQPSPAKQKLLRRWIELSSKGRASTLAIHDTPRDALRAIGGKVRSHADRVLRSSDSIPG